MFCPEKMDGGGGEGWGWGGGGGVQTIIVPGYQGHKTGKG